MQMIQEYPADSMDTLSAGFFVSFLEDSIFLQYFKRYCAYLLHML